MAASKGVKAHFQKSTPVFALLRLAGRTFIRVGHKLNTLKWRLAGVEIGPGSIIEMGVAIEAPRFVKIGARCRVQTGSRLTGELIGKMLILEDEVQINRDVLLDHSGGITLKKRSLVSEGAIIYTHSHGYDPHSVPTATHVEIGERVWVGMQALVMPSASVIGDGAVIAARSVVTKPVAPGSLMVGSPAKALRVLAPEDQPK
jgi:acetyltransferase-like isoleucine patch superfamily enzyme